MTSSPYSCGGCKRPIPFGVNFCPECGFAQPRVTGPLWAGERRLVTVLFADLAAFTLASEDADPEDVIDMLNQVFARLMVECDREGGYLDKIVGDQMMVLFGAPRAHEDAAVRAVRAALAMQDAMNELYPLMTSKVGMACKLHIGIHTGPVVWGQVGPPGRATPTVIGDAVNLASRLEEFSAGGQIVVSEAVYLRTYRYFEYKPLEAVQLRGKSGAVPVYAALRVRPGTTSRLWLVDANIPLLERSEEKELLHQDWANALTGRPQSVLLVADVGLGKSRLLAEFASSLAGYPAEKQPIILHTRFESSGETDDYSPLVGLLHQLFAFNPDDTELIRRRKVEDRAQVLGISDKTFVPLIGYLLGWYQDDARLASSERDQARLRASAINAGVQVFLKQSTYRPLVLLMDDMHWADAVSLEWLSRLNLTGRELVERDFVPHRLMTVAALRPQAGATIESLRAGRVINLAPLTDMARRDRIEFLLPGQGLPLPLIERISRESGGNALYIVELARGLVQSGQLVRHDGLWQLNRPVSEIDMPHSIAELVMANLDTLSPEARNVLQHASVIGMQFSYAALMAISPSENLDRILAELEQRGFISQLSGTGNQRLYAFGQPLVREVTYSSILRKKRRDLHARIAQLAESQAPAAEQDVEALAYHYAEGVDVEKTIAYNWLTGQRALAQYRFEDAYKHLRVAWDNLKQDATTDPLFQLELAEALGDAATFVDDYALAETCYETARALIGQRPGGSAELAYRIGRLHLYRSNVGAACRSYTQALEQLEPGSALAAQIEAELRLLFDVG